MPDYRAVESLSEVKSLVKHLLNEDAPIAFDTETGYVGPVRNSGSLRVYEPSQLVVGLSLTNSVDWARYLPLQHDHHDNLPMYETWEAVKPLFENKTILAHNFLFDMRNVQMLHVKGDGPQIEFGKFDDTLLMSYVLGKTPLHGLKMLTKHYFDYEQASLKSLFPDQKTWSYSDAKKLRFNELPVTPDVVSYVCDDARWVIRLFEIFAQEFRKPENERLRFIYQVEKEILTILADMQNRGVAFDWEQFEEDYRKGRRMEDYMAHEVRQRFLRELGRESFDDVVNFNSATQMRKLLYQDLGLTTARVTKTGELSTDQTTLLGLASQSPGAAKLAEYKKFHKNLGFFETWDAYRDGYDGRIHSNLSQTMIQAGRFASNDPNIQNVKKEFWFQVPEGEREDLMEEGTNGKDYWYGSQRGYLVASEDYTLLSYDVSQGELRTLAGLSNEPYLKHAFDTGEDIHIATAAQMFRIPTAQVTKDLRARGKALWDEEVVLTPNGWARMGDLAEGDEVMSPDGTVTEVEAVFPQGVRDLFEVTLIDGTTIIADGEHLWPVSQKKLWPVSQKKSRKSALKTTMELKECIESSTTTKYMIENVSPLEFGESALPVDPYVLGMLLGAETPMEFNIDMCQLSVEQRTRLLQGLMDVCGTEFPADISDGIIFLVRSLGGYAEKRGESVVVDMDNHHRQIMSIKPYGRGRATCIRVKNPLHEFITRGVTRTHNTMNFAILYGQGSKALGEQLNISTDEADTLMEQYFSAFKNVTRWMDNQKRMAHRLQYVETFLGRRVTLWDMQRGDDMMFVSKAERLAVNASVQGGLADIMKLSMIRASRALKKKGWWDKEVRLLMNQHDSLVFEVHKSLPLGEVYDTVLPAVQWNPSGRYVMTTAGGKQIGQDLSFPDFVTDWEYGTTWGKMQDFDREVSHHGE